MGFLKLLPFITVVLVGTDRAWGTTLDSSDLVARVDLRNTVDTEHIVQPRFNEASATVRAEEGDSTVGNKPYLLRRGRSQGYNPFQRSPRASKNARATPRVALKPKSKITTKPKPKLALKPQPNTGKAAAKPKALNPAGNPKHSISKARLKHKAKVQSTSAKPKPKAHSAAIRHKPKVPTAPAPPKHKSTKASGFQKHKNHHAPSKHKPKVQNFAARHKPKVHSAAAKHKPKVSKVSAPLKHKGSKAFRKHKPKAHKVEAKHRNKAHTVHFKKTTKAAPHRKPKPHKVATKHKVQAHKAVARPKHQPDKQSANNRSKAPKQHNPKSTKISPTPQRKVAKTSRPNQRKKPKTAPGGKGPICRRGPGESCGNQRSASPDRASTSSSEGGVVDLKDVSIVGPNLLAGDSSRNRRTGANPDDISPSTYNYLGRVGDLHANTALQGRLGYKGVPGPGAIVNSNPPSSHSSSSSQSGSPHVNAQTPSNNNQASSDVKPNTPADSSSKPNPGMIVAGGVKGNGGEEEKSFLHSDSEEDLSFFDAGSGSE
ncbi:unnamed protein product [Clonostachys chloroleuca]|uniref:Uncharacterized protein n=1 Tax=Clonostachys chloroleuca TaxID=1926264 RepID=A0AA35M9N0_9HYPO|nr:unnamed protein product [Clonostachys chloroleuca]